MDSLYLPARVGAADAVRQFGRPRFRNLFGLWRARPVKRTPDGQAASLELVWMPAYAFRLALSKGEIRSSTWVSVDASFGGFALFERMNVLEEGEPEGPCFPPVMPQDKAETLARQGLLRYVLRKRGVKPQIEATEDTILFFAPVWVFYFYRSGGRIDVAILDGYTGGPMGGQMRAAIVNAFIRKRQESAVSP